MKREYNTILDDADSVNRINFVPSQRDLHDQGHPMNLILKYLFFRPISAGWEIWKKRIYLEGMLLGNRLLRVSEGI